MVVHYLQRRGSTLMYALALRPLLKSNESRLDTVIDSVSNQVCFLDTLLSFLDTLSFFLDTLVSYLDTLSFFLDTLASFPDTYLLVRPPVAEVNLVAAKGAAVRPLLTKGPMWGHPVFVLGAISSFLEPFRGYLSSKIDKFSQELTLRYHHEEPWVVKSEEARLDTVIHSVSNQVLPQNSTS